MRTFLCEFWNFISALSIIITVACFIFAFSPNKRSNRKTQNKLVTLAIICVFICFGSYYVYRASVIVNNVVGLPVELATQTLQENGMNVVIYPTIQSDETIVKSQEPKSNIYVSAGSTVTLFLEDDLLVESEVLQDGQKSLSLQILAQNYIIEKTSKELLSKIINAPPFEDRFTL